MTFLQVKTHAEIGATPTPAQPSHAALLVTEVLRVECDSIFTTVGMSWWVGAIQSGGAGSLHPGARGCSIRVASPH